MVNCGRHCDLLQFIESKIKSNKVTMAPRTLADPRLHLPRLLLKNPGAKSTELAGLAQVSTPTMVRMLNEMEVDVLRLGKAGEHVTFCAAVCAVCLPQHRYSRLIRMALRQRLVNWR